MAPFYFFVGFSIVVRLITLVVFPTLMLVAICKGLSFLLRRKFSFRLSLLISVVVVCTFIVLLGYQVMREREAFASNCPPPKPILSTAPAGESYVEVDDAELIKILGRHISEAFFVLAPSLRRFERCFAEGCLRADKSATIEEPGAYQRSRVTSSSAAIVLRTKVTTKKSVFLPTYLIEYSARSKDGGILYSSATEMVQTWGKFSFFREALTGSSDSNAWSCGYVTQAVHEFRKNDYMGPDERRYAAVDKKLLGR